MWPELQSNVRGQGASGQGKNCSIQLQKISWHYYLEKKSKIDYITST